VFSGPAHRFALAVVAAACLAAGGCAYTVNTTQVEPPELGPEVATGRAAVLGAVQDRRAWPQVAAKEPIPHVRVFAPEITDFLRRGLVERGLFAALPAPDQARGVDSRLMVRLNTFKLTETGNNSWVIPHLLLDGVALPAFGAVNLASAGRVDMGGYLFPSTAMAVQLKLAASWREPALDAPVLERVYQITEELGAVSERRLWQEMGEPGKYGAAVSREGGQEALASLLEHMVRDPHWIYLDDYQRLAFAEAALRRYRQAADPQVSRPVTPASPQERPTPYRRYTPTFLAPVNPLANAPVEPQELVMRLEAAETEAAAAPTLAEMVQVARSLLPLMRELAFSQEEAAVLTDGYLDPDKRAAIVNEIRAQRRGLESPAGLPPEDRLDAEAAAALYDSPAVARSQVEAELAQRALDHCLAVLTPQTGEEEQGMAAGLRQGLADQMALALTGKPRLQALLLQRADRAVATAWPPMRELLQKVGSPLTRRYLARRGS
jgi:hypothetical protein